MPIKYLGKVYSICGIYKTQSQLIDNFRLILFFTWRNHSIHHWPPILMIQIDCKMIANCQLINNRKQTIVYTL